VIAAAVVSSFWLRPAEASTIGVIADGFCQRKHLFSQRFNLNDRAWHPGLRQSRRSVCARDGHAHLSNPDQKLPALATFANVRLKVTGESAVKRFRSRGSWQPIADRNRTGSPRVESSCLGTMPLARSLRLFYAAKWPEFAALCGQDRKRLAECVLFVVHSALKSA
jgi:hypothetical protein